MALGKIVKCKGITPAVWVQTDNVDPNGVRWTSTRLKRDEAKCRETARYIENRSEECARPVCDRCANPFARLSYLTESDVERWGI